MQLGDTTQYKAALEALNGLQQQLGTTEELKAIARFLLHSYTAEPVPSRFAWVGTDDPRDRAVVQTYNQAWQEFLLGNDD
jgi:hypothetical protein